MRYTRREVKKAFKENKPAKFVEIIDAYESMHRNEGNSNDRKGKVNSQNADSGPRSTQGTQE